MPFGEFVKDHEGDLFNYILGCGHLIKLGRIGESMCANIMFDDFIKNKKGFQFECPLCCDADNNNDNNINDKFILSVYCQMCTYKVCYNCSRKLDICPQCRTGWVIEKFT